MNSVLFNRFSDVAATMSSSPRCEIVAAVDNRGRGRGRQCNHTARLTPGVDGARWNDSGRAAFHYTAARTRRGRPPRPERGEEGNGGVRPAWRVGQGQK